MNSGTRGTAVHARRREAIPKPVSQAGRYVDTDIRGLQIFEDHRIISSSSRKHSRTYSDIFTMPSRWNCVRAQRQSISALTSENRRATNTEEIRHCTTLLISSGDKTPLLARGVRL